MIKKRIRGGGGGNNVKKEFEKKSWINKNKIIAIMKMDYFNILEIRKKIL